MKRLFLLSVCIFSMLLSTDLSAQIRTPSPSPTSTVSQKVGLTDVTLVYSRPSMKDRKIFADGGLVPYGEIWRTGANAATKFSFGDDVKLGGAELKGGDYAVLTVPGPQEWKVMLYPYESGNWNSYTEKDPAASFTVEAQQMDGVAVESFLINIDNLRNASATIDLVWESTYVAIPLEVEVESRVMADIERTMGGPSSNDYYAAATYYHESGKDLEKALAWIQKATKENPRYWQVRREALILADMNRKKEAVAAAKKSLELAKKAGNKDYVRMNEASIAEWGM